MSRLVSVSVCIVLRIYVSIPEQTIKRDYTAIELLLLQSTTAAAAIY